MSSETTVTSLSATCHYGVKVLATYDAIRDRGRPFKESIDDGIVTQKVSTFIIIYSVSLICMQMIWFIHRGDDLSKTDRIPFTLCGNFTQHEYDTENLWLSSGLYESQEEYVQVTLQILISLIDSSN